jgi:hypothetical protein
MNNLRRFDVSYNQWTGEYERSYYDIGDYYDAHEVDEVIADLISEIETWHSIMNDINRTVAAKDTTIQLLKKDIEIYENNYSG